MMWLRFAPYIAIGALTLGLWGVWGLYQRADERADRAEASLKTEEANAKVVTKYVERIVKVPGPAIVRERLVGRVCDADPVPGAGSPDAPAGADSGDRRPDEAGGLAADLTACQRNKMKLEALQEVLRPQVK